MVYASCRLSRTELVIQGRSDGKRVESVEDRVKGGSTYSVPQRKLLPDKYETRLPLARIGTKVSATCIVFPPSPTNLSR